MENDPVRCAVHGARTQDTKNNEKQNQKRKKISRKRENCANACVRIEKRAKRELNFYATTAQPQYDDEIYCAEKTRSTDDARVWADESAHAASSITAKLQSNKKKTVFCGPSERTGGCNS